MFKIESKFRKCKKKRKKNNNKMENVFRFSHKCNWKSYNKLPLLRRKYLLSAVSGLTNSSKILYIAWREFFNQNFLHRDL